MVSTSAAAHQSTKKLESSGAALTQSVELMLDVQERFPTVPNGPVSDRVTAKLKAVLDKNPGFYVLKQVSNVLSGTDSKIPDHLNFSQSLIITRTLEDTSSET
ncbi:hypothetical protein HPB50_008460 [Hyalomma asiaticum]|uniref:Uncharacterized protein n=1 Tax=Hyalomma asiaticum TaxID=266040 RepID=A0ACB7SL72_HYAAI|nr:hypothetical protein HPB50_008460 [Hyalomma asiaticum]